MVVTVVTWLWGNKYTEHHVRVMRAMVGRHLPIDHRFVCISDRKIDGVECVPLPKRPIGATAESIRLWLFSRYAREAIGATDFLNLDIDMVITGDLTAMVTDPSRFRIWKSDSVGRHGFALNPSVMLVRGNELDHVWDMFTFDCKRVLRVARDAGWTGTEQAVIAHHFQRRHELPDVWTADDGILSMRVLENSAMPASVHRDLPGHARIVSFHGNREPSQYDIPWVKEHWRC